MRSKSSINKKQEYNNTDASRSKTVKSTVEPLTDYFIGRGKTPAMWSKTPNFQPSENDPPKFTALPGINPELRGLSRFQFFDYLINHQMLSKIVDDTNQRLVPGQKLVTLIEIRAYIGLLLLFGATGKEEVEISEIWAPCSNHHLNWATACMPREKFQFISSNIRFDDLNAR